MKYIFIIVCALFTLNMTAQPPDDGDRKSRKEEMRNQIKSLLIAHVTKELELTTAEAQKFWPLYNEIKEERDRLERQKKVLIKKVEKTFDNMSEKEAASYVDQMVALDQKISATNIDYKHDEIIAVIGAKRFLKLKKAEVDFRRKMMREYRDRRSRK
ncbi:sensor of ECF-type sigma factor [Nonlabens dokdonensis]|nr:sensor of ECF-type sigma factor [Nonlabens dokdonensis]